MSGRRSLSMEYEEPSDSSGTDDDLPPTHSGRASRGVRVSGNGRAVLGGPIYASSQSSSVDHMVHRLEQEAYTAVLRAFGAQSEVITWAKERLMTDLRKELRVSDEQHRECLGKVASDDTLRQIQQFSTVPGFPSASLPPAEVSLNPASSQSRKKQKMAQAALPPPPPPVAAPAPSVKSASAPSQGPKRGPPPGQRGKKQKGGRAGTTPRGASGHKNSVGRPASSNKNLDVPADTPIDPYVGRRVKTRWPEDNAFYEAVITDYNPQLDAHALVYDMDTENETWEWINLKEVPPGDLKWVEGPNAVIVGRKAPPPGSRGTMGRGMKKTKGSFASPGTGRQRGGARGVSGRGWRNSTAIENGSRSVELVALDDLAKEVDKLGEEGKFETAKRTAKAHEEAIRKVLAEVGESSDEAESDEAGHAPSSRTQSIDHEREQRSRQNSRDHTVDSDEDETAGNDGSDGEHTAGAASDAEEDQHGDDGDDKDDDG